MQHIMYKPLGTIHISNLGITTVWPLALRDFPRRTKAERESIVALRWFLNHLTKKITGTLSRLILWPETGVKLGY